MIASMHPVLSLSHVVVSAALERPVGNAHARWSARRSVIVTLEDDGGRKGRGEAAPLPGVSDESVDDVLAALGVLGTSLEPTETDLRRLPLSLRFALESALLDLRAGDRPAYVALLGDDALSARVPERIELQVLLDDLEEADERAREAHRRGARTFKVKIGRDGRAHDEAALLERLRALGRDVVIRADANGALAEPEILGPAMTRARVEYVEDPGPLEARRWVGVPVALDATVAADPFDAIARARSLGASFLILKPTLLGGLEEILSLAARARARGLKVVLSHCLEGPIGLAAIAHLALAAGAASRRALWGAQGLAPWPGCDRFTAPDGTALAMPYYLGEARLLRPSSAGLGLS